MSVATRRGKVPRDLAMVSGGGKGTEEMSVSSKWRRRREEGRRRREEGGGHACGISSSYANIHTSRTLVWQSWHGKHCCKHGMAIMARQGEQIAASQVGHGCKQASRAWLQAASKQVGRSVRQMYGPRRAFSRAAAAKVRQAAKGWIGRKEAMRGGM